MKIITGATGTPHVTSNNDGEFNQGIWGDGLVVLSNGNKLSATIKDANTINIKDGDLVFQGRHALIEPGKTEDVAIDSGAAGKKRNDLICIRYELDDSTGYETMSFVVKKGSATSGTPSDPAYTEGNIRTGSLVAEYPLYRVKLDGISISVVDKLFNVTSINLSRLDGIFDNLYREIEQEVENRSNADNNLYREIEEEVENRSNADNNLYGAIEQEAESRRSADDNLYGAIEQEAESRRSADDNLYGAMDGLAREVSDKQDKPTRYSASNNATVDIPIVSSKQFTIAVCTVGSSSTTGAYDGNCFVTGGSTSAGKVVYDGFSSKYTVTNGTNKLTVKNSAGGNAYFYLTYLN